VVNRWNENDSNGYVFAKKATIKSLGTISKDEPYDEGVGIARFRASFGNIAGFGYEAAAAS
jgi:hypothetical protein